jgi:hypothetical protein
MSKHRSSQPAAERMHPVTDPQDPSGKPLHVPLPPAADGSACVTADEAKEAEHFVRTLDANDQISRALGPTPPGATHEIVERDGVKRLQRKRFSAI